MRNLLLGTLLFFYFTGTAVSSPYQIQINAGYRPQVTTSEIRHSYLSSWDGFIDIPVFGVKFLTPLYNEWYIASCYRYQHKTSPLAAGNRVTFDQHTVIFGPYYRSPTTDSNSFFINLSAGFGISATSFEPVIAGGIDNFGKTSAALMLTLGLEGRIFSTMSMILELNYSALDYILEGSFGMSGINEEITIRSSGFDLDIGLGYEFNL